MKLVAVATALLVLGSIAQAEQAQYEKLGFSSQTEMENYLTITDVKVTAVPVNQHDFDAPANPAIALGGDLLETLGPVLADPSSVTGWIAFGKKAWEVVVANKPVVNVQTTRVTILPNDKSQWAQMAGWRGPNAAAYSFQAVNGFGITTVDQKYTVSYNYGGSLNGKGAYLANVTIIPTTISVAWAYTLDSSVEVGQILNAGTVASPVPAVDMQLKWNIKTILKESQNVDSFYVKGDGSLQHVSR